MSPYYIYIIGNISSDGVHPSSQGYTWWGCHISEAIIATQFIYDINTTNSSNGSDNSSSNIESWYEKRREGEGWS